ncbi:hypothetical protein [Shinella pollutisoli]|uniref:LapB rubredoxin metal binding domain-containing protein n=1 Tax=Shinella pollutisoli TaxID=2250594 RepID=A0ABV7DKJ1_9HYPH|nr:hypothetical protein [Shinella pollutisoli]
MRHPHALQVCLSCNRPLPRAARRCPWCKRLSVMRAEAAAAPMRRAASAGERS